MWGMRQKCSAYDFRYVRTVEAGGKRGVEGGKEKLVHAITGCGRFVVSESYIGVAGGSPIGGAGSL